MERRTFLKLAALVPGLALAGCGGSKTLLSPKDPTMLSIWHVYGEQADSPMNSLLTEFNDTVGREKGILLNVTNMTNSAAIGGQLQDAKAGKPGALDYPLRLVELNALEQGSGELYKGSWYDLTNETFRASWMEFARALVQGDILISDLYSNTQVMTGETLAGLGSSAAILYYNDFVTYPDNTTEPTDLLLAPLPHAAGTATPLMPQAGVGLCAFKTTDQKAEAAAVFLRWLTEQQRNLEFAADTGYMPVSSAAFDAIADYPFEQQSYQRLYDVYNEMRIQNTPLSEPGIVGYHAKAKTLYDSLRQRQKDYPQRLADGETLEALAEETWQLLCDNA